LRCAAVGEVKKLLDAEVAQNAAEIAKKNPDQRRYGL